MQRHVTLLGDLVSDRTLELGHQWQHGAEHFSERSKVVVRNPASQAEQAIIQHRRSIEYVAQLLGRNRRLAIVQFHDDPRHALLAEWNQNASAHDWHTLRRNAVSE